MIKLFTDRDNFDDLVARFDPESEVSDFDKVATLAALNLSNQAVWRPIIADGEPVAEFAFYRLREQVGSVALLDETAQATRLDSHETVVFDSAADAIRHVESRVEQIGTGQ